ncbi:XRE family transcriptional regulator [Pedobacter aquatilis]|uniref:helix-turn-helix domain-containing protein n=1 Tax=Pedobacter aquatilis TaxID=351343 RepID=UPI0025B450B2|nr:XRE family transcriptional regulator [Pedobacter aquatilis]MDN3586081.1 XRE family transcriptional regulator [Pedobacter aquatilis]
MNTLFSERFRSARLLSGLSLQELADELDNRISRQALHKYEKGEVVPNSEMIGYLCDVLNVRPDFFFTDVEVKLGEIEFRKLDKLPAKEENRIIEQTKDFLSRYLELEKIIGLAYEFKNPLANFGVVDTPAQAEEAADQVRISWKLGMDPISNTVELLEDNHIKVVEFEADLGFDGMQTLVNGKVPVIAVNISRVKKDDRKRFTVMHELGHLLMSLSPDMPLKRKETLCNHFAGAMLFPTELIRKELGVKRNKLLIQELGVLKQEYGISIQATVMRARATGIISNRYCDEFFTYIKQMNWQVDEPFDFSSAEKSNRFEQLLFRALGEELISVTKAAALYNMKLAEFKSNVLAVV